MAFFFPVSTSLASFTFMAISGEPPVSGWFAIMMVRCAFWILSAAALSLRTLVSSRFSGPASKKCRGGQRPEN